MKKRVFIIHGWDGHPKEGWYPWLKKQLENKDFSVEVPEMPNPTEPVIEAWVSHLTKVVGEIDENTFFIGHSIGCQTILRYLENLPEKEKVGGAVFVAGWFSLTNLSGEEEKRIAQPWLDTPINFARIKPHLNKGIAIFSDNDPLVPLDDQHTFQEKLGSDIVIQNQKGHFSGDDGITELPIALESVLKLAK